MPAVDPEGGSNTPSPDLDSFVVVSDSSSSKTEEAKTAVKDETSEECDSSVLDASAISAKSEEGEERRKELSEIDATLRNRDGLHAKIITAFVNEISNLQLYQFLLASNFMHCHCQATPLTTPTTLRSSLCPRSSSGPGRRTKRSYSG